MNKRRKLTILTMFTWHDLPVPARTLWALGWGMIAKK